MKTLKYILPIVLVLLMMFGCGKYTTTNPESVRDFPFWGYPKKIHVASVSDDDTLVSFGIIADSHCDASWAGWVPGHDYEYRDTPRMINNRKTEHCIKIDAANHGCLGIIHLGDVVDANTTQNLVAFRQIWENDYPGYCGGYIAGTYQLNFWAYSQGYKINLPVFPTLGNHDIPPYSDNNKDWNEVSDYIHERIHGADGIVSYHGNGAYAWRWGQYFFVQLGTWAGSGTSEGSFSPSKLDWFEDILATQVGNTNIGVLIFQHYGWDGFSTNGDWWTHSDRDKELNILCRRESTDDPANPYNIIGIFTGHHHVREHTILDVGHDHYGNEVNFVNYQMMSSGSLTKKQFGFSIVTLEGNLMRISTNNVHTNCWSIYTTPIQVGW